MLMYELPQKIGQWSASGGFFSTLKPQFSFDGSVLTIQRDFAIYRCAEDTVRNDALSQETNITVRLKSLGDVWKKHPSCSST